MPKEFSDGAREDYAILARVMRQYHHELTDAQSKVCLTLVKGFDKDQNPEPALKLHGHFCEATVRLVPRRRKIRQDHDIEIDIDGHMWEEKSDRQKEALMDHELSHVKIVVDKHNMPKRDEDERVKLTLVPDEIFITGFLSVIRHYGNDAGEYLSIQSAMEAAATEIANMSAATAEATAAAAA